MARKRTLFSKLTGQYFFALTSAAVLISGLIAILLTGWNRRLIMAFLCIGFVMAAASLLLYLMKTLPEGRRYSHLTRRFRDGEIYQDYIRGIDGLFPYLKEDIDRLDALIDRQNIMQLSTKQAEFLALQNQINPHSSTIRWTPSAATRWRPGRSRSPISRRRCPPFSATRSRRPGIS